MKSFFSKNKVLIILLCVILVIGIAFCITLGILKSNNNETLNNGSSIANVDKNNKNDKDDKIEDDFDDSSIEDENDSDEDDTDFGNQLDNEVNNNTNINNSQNQEELINNTEIKENQNQIHKEQNKNNQIKDEQDKNTENNTQNKEEQEKTPQDNTQNKEEQDKTPDNNTQNKEEQDKTPEDDTQNKEEQDKTPEDDTQNKEEQDKIPEDNTEIKDDENEQPQESEDEQPIPSKFDLRDKIDIKVANQTPFGNCWIFASMKCVETNLALTQGKYYDFSEIHADYLTSNLLTKNGRKVHTGGYFSSFFEYNLQFKGFVEESKLEYRDYTEEEYSNFPDIEVIPINITEYVDFSDYIPKDENSENAEFAELQKAVKRHIMKYGSVMTMMTVPKIEPVYDIYYHHFGEPGAAHAMSIIGWDDSYPKEKFISPTGYTPKNDGAYLVLNSWGENSGYNGYVYVSYEDCEVNTGLTGIISTSDDRLINLDNIQNKELVDAIKNNYKEYIINKNGKLYINKKFTNILDLSNSNISSLEGIEKFNTINEVNLSNNNITNIEPLQHFVTLHSLDISNNKVQDVSVLEKNRKLRVLNLENNNKVKGYGKVTTLFDLNLKDCNIEFLEDIGKITELENLNISGNNIKSDFEFLKTLKLYNLNLSNCNLKVMPKVDTTNLLELNLSDNNITDLSNIMNEKIDKLVMKNCNITDIKILPENITTLDLSGNKNITNIQELKNVPNLILKDCNITDVTIFNNMQLDSIDLSNNIGLYGNLNVNRLTINNCNLNDDFNFFGNTYYKYLSVYGNDLSLDYILEKLYCEQLRYNDISVDELYKIPSYVRIVETVLIYDYEVPNIESVVDIHSIIKDYSSSGRQLVDYKNMELNKYLQKGKVLAEESQAVFNYITSDTLSSCTLQINIFVNNSLKGDYINIKNIPQSYKANDEVDFSELIVEVVYENGYSKKVNDYTIEGNKILKEGINEYIVRVDGMETTFIIECEELVKLQFKTEELLKKVSEWVSENEIISKDLENKILIITKQGALHIKDSYIKIDSSMIADIDSLKDIPLFEILIEYDGHKIDESDIEKLSLFTDVNTLYIINNTNEKNEDIIVEQDRFNIEFRKE